MNSGPESGKHSNHRGTNGFISIVMCDKLIAEG